MSETLQEKPLTEDLFGEWRNNLDEATSLFFDVLHNARPTMGRIELLDGSIDVAEDRRPSPDYELVLVVTHNHKEVVDVGQDGNLHEVPATTRYVIDLAAADDEPKPVDVVERTFEDEHDAMRRLFIERFTLSDPDSSEVQAFLAAFTSEEVGQKALDEKLCQLQHQYDQILHHVKRDLPPKPRALFARQLTTAQRLKQLLREAKTVQPTQNARAEVAREEED